MANLAVMMIGVMLPEAELHPNGGDHQTLCQNTVEIQR